jgi:DnaJ-class molecular chaperone
MLPMSAATLPRICPWCFGAKACRGCNGHGHAVYSLDDGDHQSRLTDCAECHGTGICSTCNGTGEVSESGRSTLPVS